MATLKAETITNAHAQTEALLDFAVSHLMSFPGPKFIGGDWNFLAP